MVLLSGMLVARARLLVMEPALLLTTLVLTHRRNGATSSLTKCRCSAHHLSSATTSAAGAHFERDHPPRVPRLIPCIPDEPRHLSHATERPPADLAVRRTLPPSHSASHPPSHAEASARSTPFQARILGSFDTFSPRCT